MARLTLRLTGRGQDNESHTSAWLFDYCPSISESSGSLGSRLTVLYSVHSCTDLSESESSIAQKVTCITLCNHLRRKVTRYECGYVKPRPNSGMSFYVTQDFPYLVGLST